MSNYTISAPLAMLIANTCDTTLPDPEFLRTPADLTAYLQRWGIMSSRAPDQHDLVEVRALREHLRDMFATHDLTIMIETLNGFLDGIEVKPHIGLTTEGATDLHLDVNTNLPVARRLAALAALGLQASIAQYGIERFHMCEASACSDVFIDTSRNHTRRYCCEQCANRHNVAAFRRRRKAEASAQ